MDLATQRSLQFHDTAIVEVAVMALLKENINVDFREELDKKVVVLTVEPLDKPGRIFLRRSCRSSDQEKIALGSYSVLVWREGSYKKHSGYLGDARKAKDNGESPKLYW